MARVLAIVRFRSTAPLRDTLLALAGGGIELLEVTLDTPGALDAAADAARTGRAVGVGTVTTPDEVRAAAAVGARFLVSPGLSREVLATAADVGIEAIPGVLTPTDVMQARSLGAATVKLFPASLGGPAYLRTLRGPFPSVAFVPTGGISIEEIPAYLRAGATAVGLGGELVGRVPAASDDDLEGSRGRAAAAVAAVTGWEHDRDEGSA